VIAEEGSELASQLWGTDHTAASSILAYPEGRAALAAARRGDRLGEAAHVAALSDFEDLLSDLTTVGVDEALARHAGGLAEAHGLRGYDAVHLATALALGGEPVTLVTWDGDLAEAAIEEGLSVAAT
jgi:uncharacterized protein